jgi:hypothetical protein
MKPQGKKQKGSRAERNFAQLLVDAELDPYAKRMVLSGSVFGLEGDIFSKLPFLFEIKHHEKIRLWEFWDQAKEQSLGLSKRPVLVVRSNKRDFLVAMAVDDWLELAWYALNKGEKYV